MQNEKKTKNSFLSVSRLGFVSREVDDSHPPRVEILQFENEIINCASTNFTLNPET